MHERISTQDEGGRVCIVQRAGIEQRRSEKPAIAGKKEITIPYNGKM